MCREYCHRRCKTCNQTRTDCYECADFYEKESGECVLKDATLQIVNRVRPLVNFIKRKGLKSFFVAIDDLWLYNYHKRQYDGTVKTVFNTIRFIEEKQWEIIELEEIKDKIEQSIQEAPSYNPFSNPTYLDV